MNLVLNGIYTENNNVFCNKNNVEECVQYLTKEFLSLGVTGLSEVESHKQMKNFLLIDDFDNKNNNNDTLEVENLTNNDLRNIENLVWVINNSYTMVTKLRRAHESKSNLQDSYSKVSSELSQAKRECDRWKEKVEKMEKDLGCVENQKELMQKKIIELEKCLKKEKSEVRSLRLELSRVEEKCRIRIGKLQRQLDTLSMKLQCNPVKDFHVEKKKNPKCLLSTTVHNAFDLYEGSLGRDDPARNVEEGSTTFSESSQTNSISENIEKISHCRKPNQKPLHSKSNLSNYQMKKNLASTKIHRKVKGNFHKKSTDFKGERKLAKKPNMYEKIISTPTYESDNCGLKINDATFTEDPLPNARMIRRGSYTILKHNPDEDVIKAEVGNTECVKYDEGERN